MTGLRRDGARRDRLNNLPNEIVLHILSFLTIREAVITSALSRKWQHLWKSSFKILKFDDEDILGPRGSRDMEDPRKKFANLVNHIMDQCQDSHVVELHISYLRRSSSSEKTSEFDGGVFGRWISFALTREVTNLCLKLGFVHNWTLPSIDDQQSNFSCFKDLNLVGFWMEGNSNLQSFKYLTSLSLFLVYFEERSDFESILSTCLSLEKLYLDNVSGLEYLSIVESSLKLKCLEFYNCELELIELNAPDLRKLTYKTCLSPDIDLKIGTLKLGEIKLSLPYRKLKNRVNNIIGYFNNDLFRLQTIVLEISPYEVQFATTPIFPNLKTLVLEVVRFREESYLTFARLLKASPLLCRFELQLLDASQDHEEPETRNKEIEIEDDRLSWNHTCLKEIFVGGFCGYECELELLNYLVKTCTSLKKVTLDPYNYKTRCKSRGKEKEKETYPDVQNRTMQFRKNVRACVEFVVI